MKPLNPSEVLTPDFFWEYVNCGFYWSPCPIEDTAYFMRLYFSHHGTIFSPSGIRCPYRGSFIYQYAWFTVFITNAFTPWIRFLYCSIIKWKCDFCWSSWWWWWTSHPADFHSLNNTDHHSGKIFEKDHSSSWQN